MSKFIATMVIIAGVLFGGLKVTNYVLGNVIESEINKDCGLYQYAEVVDCDVISGDVKIHLVDARAEGSMTYVVNMRSGDGHVVDFIGFTAQ